MPDIGVIRTEIVRMRCQVLRQRGEIRQLQQGASPASQIRQCDLGRCWSMSLD
jgi:hypothetical protein